MCFSLEMQMQDAMGLAIIWAGYLYNMHNEPRHTLNKQCQTIIKDRRRRETAGNLGQQKLINHLSYCERRCDTLEYLSSTLITYNG